MWRWNACCSMAGWTYLDKSARRRLAGKIGARMAERVGDVYVVVATDGAILTVGHRIHHIRRY